MNKTKYYFLPFLDNLLAVLISLLFTAFFGSWFTFKPFAFLAGTLFTLTMCGLIYSRMWKLSRKNTRYGYDLTNADCVKFILPLVLFSLALVLTYLLADKNILPFKENHIKTYYTFPDNLPRVPVHITDFDYVTVFVRFWFTYMTPFSLSTNSYLLLLAPVLMFASGMLGFKLGSENKEVLVGTAKVIDKVKEKFNE